jgi:hypothetical protein
MYDPTKKYAGYIKRNIIDLKSNSELRVLACIHRPDNIPATINLLEATYPTKEEPICTYVLQLIELIGRTSPIFICHDLQRKKKSNSNTSMAEKLLESFRSFEREFQDCLVVSAFTAISPPEMMYDDICTLALDKLTSLIRHRTIIIHFYFCYTTTKNNYGCLNVIRFLLYIFVLL